MAERACASRYALLDLARAPQLLPAIAWLEALGAAKCLFEGVLAEPVRRASPFIVAAARAPELIRRWGHEGAGQSWGVIMEAPSPLHAARRHVRRFLQARLPDGSGPVMVRLWDPRVLGVLLTHGDQDQIAGLLPPGIAFLVERDAAIVVRYERTGGSLLATQLAWSAMADGV